MVLSFTFILGIVFSIFSIMFLLPLFLINNKSEKQKTEWKILNRKCRLIYILFILIFVGYITYNSADFIL